MRICVIGAGIVGASVAYRLAARPDVSITMVDRSGVGNGTTMTSFSWGCDHPHSPREYFWLNHVAMQEYERLRRELPSTPPWYFGGGALYVSADIASLLEQVERVQPWGARAEVWKADLARDELEPQLVVDGCDSNAVFFPDDFAVDAAALTNQLVDRAISDRSYGHFGAAVVAIEPGPGTSHRVLLDGGGWIEADVVVNAAGPAADHVAAMVRRTLPMRPTRGLVVQLRAPGDPIRRVVITDTIALHPDGAGLVRIHDRALDRLVGSGQSGGTQELVSELCARAARVCSDLDDAVVTATWLGVRPEPADGFSCIGGVTAIPGYYEVVTHSGVTLGPLLGRLFTEELIDGRRSELLAGYSPDRF